MSTIEIEVPSCPAPPLPMGIPSWVVGWGYAIGTTVVLVLIVSIAFVITDWHEQKTKRLKDERAQEVALAQLRKSCIICGEVYPKEKVAK